MGANNDYIIQYLKGWTTTNDCRFKRLNQYSALHIIIIREACLLKNYEFPEILQIAFNMHPQPFFWDNMLRFASEKVRLKCMTKYVHNDSGVPQWGGLDLPLWQEEGHKRDPF